MLWSRVVLYVEPLSFDQRYKEPALVEIALEWIPCRRYAFPFLLKAFIFLLFIWGWGGVIVWSRVEGCIYSCFCTTKSFGWYQRYVQNMYILIKTTQTYLALWAVKTNFCNTKTLNRSEHRTVSVYAPSPPLPFCSCLLHLLPSINL